MFERVRSDVDGEKERHSYPCWKVPLSPKTDYGVLTPNAVASSSSSTPLPCKSRFASFLPKSNLLPPRSFLFFFASLRDFASTLGLDDEKERVFLVACPLRLADATVLREVRNLYFRACEKGSYAALRCGATGSDAMLARPSRFGAELLCTVRGALVQIPFKCGVEVVL